MYSCSSSNLDDEIFKKLTAQQLYDKGILDIQRKEPKEAIRTLNVLTRKYPLSPLVPQANVLTAYAYFEDRKPDDAIRIIDDYVAVYPLYYDTDYMYYLKALCYCDQIMDLKRDQQVTYRAVEALQAVIKKFPQSQYAKDATQRLNFALSTLAGQEAEIGIFYMHQRDFGAAINRFRNIINLYGNTLFVPEALYRLCEAYYALGITDQAENYASVLNYNYPNSTWTYRAYSLLKRNSGNFIKGLGVEMDHKKKGTIVSSDVTINKSR